MDETDPTARRAGGEGRPGLLREVALAAYGPTVLAAIGHGAAVPIIAVSARELGASLGEAALVVGLLGLGQLLGDLPAGALAARVGERRALAGAAVLQAFGMLAAALAGGLVALSLSVVVVGLGVSVFGLARHAYLTDVVPLHLRARALSTLGGVHRIGAFAGPFLGAAVVSVWGTSAAYAVGAVTSLAAAVIVRLAPDPAPHHEGAGPRLRTLHVLRDHRTALLTLGVGALWISAARAVREALVPLWAESVGLTPAQTSLVFGVAGAVDMLLFYPSGWLMDRLGRVAVAVPSMLVLAAGMVLLPLTTTMVAVTAAATVLGAGNGIGSGLVMTLGSDASPAAGRAQFLAGWRLVSDVGRAAGPFALSGLTTVLTLGASAVTMGAATALGAAWLAFWVPRHDPVVRRGRRRERGPEI